MTKRKLSKGLRDAAKISTGTAIGQVFSIISLPIITRIYGSEVIGVWTTIYAISIIICTVSDCGLLQSLMVEKDEKVEITYRVISNMILFITIGASLLVFIYCRQMLRYQGDMILIVVVFSIFYALTYQQVQLNYTLLNRGGNYNILMKNPVINQVSASLISVVLGLLGLKAYGYFIGVTAGQLLTLLHMRRYIPYKFKLIKPSEAKAVIVEHRNFVCYQMPVNITLQARDQVPNLLIGAFWGSNILGYYSISQKLLNIPITFIGQALGRVFYQRCAEMKRQGENIADFFYRNLKRALVLAMIPMVFLAAYGDAAIVMFFGGEYRVGGMIVRIIVFRSFFAFVSAATRSIDIILDKQQYAMISSLTQTVLISVCIIVCYMLSLDIVNCTLIMTIIFIVIQIIYFCVMFYVMNMPVRYYLENILPSLAVVIIASFALRYAFIAITDITGWKLFVYLKSFMVL